MARRRGRRLPIVRVEDFGGGENTFFSAVKIKDTESPNSQNITYTENGLPTKRPGTVEIGSGLVTAGGQGLAPFYTVSGGRHLVAVDGTGLAYLNGTTWTAITGVTLTAGQAMNFVTARDALYGHNGTDGMVKWTGSGAATQPATGVIARFGVFYKGRHVISGNSANPSRVYLSDSSNSDDFTGSGADTIDIASDDGQKITGLAKLNVNNEETLIIFKERSIYQMILDSSGNPVVDLITDANGCVSYRSIALVENDVFYLSNDSSVRTLGYQANFLSILRTNDVSAKIRDRVGNINSAQFERCAAVYFDKKYVLAFPEGSGTTNNRMVVYHTLYGAWATWTNLSANALATYYDTTNEGKLYFISDTTAEAFAFDPTVYTDDGAAIDSFFYTKQYSFDEFDTTKRFPFVDIQFRALTGTVAIEIILDGSVTAKQVTLSATFTAEDGLRVFKFREAQFRQDNGSTASVVTIDDVRRLKVNQDAKSIQVKVSNANSGETFTLMAVGFGVRSRSPMKFDSTKVIY